MMVVAVGLASVAFAQPGAANPVPASCCPAGVNFRVRRTATPPAVQAEPGSALVYFVAEDEGSLVEHTILAGVDGHWVGATHGNSWFYFRITPGAHHLCALANPGGDALKALVHFTAEAGGVYYFEARDITHYRADWTEMTLLPLDSDEGQYLISTKEFGAAKKR